MLLEGHHDAYDIRNSGTLSGAITGRGMSNKDDQVLYSERKKFERAPGTSSGLERKVANQSVMTDSQMNDSSI